MAITVSHYPPCTDRGGFIGTRIAFDNTRQHRGQSAQAANRYRVYLTQRILAILGTAPPPYFARLILAMRSD
jgi:hypothetical protein